MRGLNALTKVNTHDRSAKAALDSGSETQAKGKRGVEVGGLAPRKAGEGTHNMDAAGGGWQNFFFTISLMFFGSVFIAIAIFLCDTEVLSNIPQL